MKATPSTPEKPSGNGRRPPPHGQAAEFNRRVRQGRDRLKLAARTIQELFGPMDPADAEAWRHGAYLSLIGNVFLALLDSGLSLADLKCLSAILCDQRRSEASIAGVRRSRQPAQEDEAPGATNGRPLSERLGPMVKRLYNLDLAAPSNRRSDAQAEKSDQDR